jgi:hypothetical protein
MFLYITDILYYSLMIVMATLFLKIFTLQRDIIACQGITITSLKKSIQLNDEIINKQNSIISLITKENHPAQ